MCSGARRVRHLSLFLSLTHIRIKRVPLGVLGNMAETPTRGTDKEEFFSPDAALGE